MPFREYFYVKGFSQYKEIRHLKDKKTFMNYTLIIHYKVKYKMQYYIYMNGRTERRVAEGGGMIVFITHVKFASVPNL